MNRFTVSLALLVTFVSCVPEKETVLGYPETIKGEVVDTYFGEKVPDPYQWLENDTSIMTKEWIGKENELTFSYLKEIPFRDQIRERLEEVYNYERLSAPFKEGDYYYFYKNDGLQNHSVLYRKKGVSGEAEVFIDPNGFSADGTKGMAGISFTKDGAMAAYLVQEGGSDWRKAVIINTADKRQLGDSLRHLKFTGLTWKGNDGLYYSSYDKPVGSELTAKTQHHKLYYHKLKTPQSLDVLVFGGEKQPRRYIGASLTEDERFLVISAANSTNGNELYIEDFSKPGSGLKNIVSNFENNHNVIANKGSRLIVQTDFKAQKNRIVEFDFSASEPEKWNDLIAETENAIRFTSTGGGKLFVNYLKDAKAMVKQFDYNGKFDREVELPGIGSVSGFSEKESVTDLFYSFTSFTYPTTIFKYDIASGKSTLYEKTKVDFDPEMFETKQVFYESKDGTKIPMFIVHKKGAELNSKNPTWLYAYGGFGISLTPSFNTSRVVWLENGGIYAQPNLRGGGEYGEDWHIAGTKVQKQNVFDDFIAAGEYLVANQYTSSEYLAIAGGSNGGLLVGATMTQRPDLAKVAFPAVGVMDMLKYHKFTAGAGWSYDYGTSEDSKDMFEYLRKYSPVHALRPDTSYPATLVTTADHDDRVVPAHSFKFAATLQEYQVGNSPVLIRIETKSGHGSSNLSKEIELQADQFSFAWYNMGVTPALTKKDM